MEVTLSDKSIPPSRTIWRYFDSKHVADLFDPLKALNCWAGMHGVSKLDPQCIPPEQGSLWFGYPRAFGNKGGGDEGTFPLVNTDDREYCRRIAKHLGLDPCTAWRRKRAFLKRDTASLRDGIRRLAGLHGVSCWRVDDDEDQRMWDDFGKAPGSIAIKCEEADLETAITYARGGPGHRSKLAFADIQYIDYANAFLPHDGATALLCHVHKRFQHENELRLIARSPSLVELQLSASAQPGDPEIKKAAEALAAVPRPALEGFFLPIDLSKCIVEVRLSPTSNLANLQLVESLVKASGQDKSCVKMSRFSAACGKP